MMHGQKIMKSSHNGQIFNKFHKWRVFFENLPKNNSNFIKIW